MSLIKIDLAHGTSLDCSLREATQLRLSPINSFRAASAVPLFALAQRTHDFTKIVGDGLRQLDALAMTSEQIANNVHDAMGHSDGRRRPWTEGSEELLIGNIVIALFDLAAANQLDRLPLAIWRGDAEVHANAGRVIKLIDHIERLFFTGETDGWETTITPNTPDWSTHIASALATTLLERLTPDALLACHALWVHYFIQIQPHLRLPVAASAALMVTDSWHSTISNPVQFVSPETSIPRLRAAIDDPSFGWVKARLVLHAGLEAVPLSEGDLSRTAIERMTD